MLFTATIPAGFMMGYQLVIRGRHADNNVLDQIKDSVKLAT